VSQSCRKWSQATRLHLAFTQLLRMAPWPGYVARGSRGQAPGMPSSSTRRRSSYAPQYHWPRASAPAHEARKTPGRPLTQGRVWAAASPILGPGRPAYVARSLSQHHTSRGKASSGYILLSCVCVWGWWPARLRFGRAPPVIREVQPPLPLIIRSALVAGRPHTLHQSFASRTRRGLVDCFLLATRERGERAWSSTLCVRQTSEGHRRPAVGFTVLHVVA